MITPYCLGHLVLVQSLPTIYTFPQSMEQMHSFEASFKMFGRAIFEAIEVKGCSRLQPQNFLDSSESLAANLKKVRQFQSSDFFCLFYCSSKTCK